MKALKFFCRYWPYFQILCGVAVSIYMCVNWGELTVVHKLALFNLLALYVHQFEEYVFPGGEPLMLNTVVSKGIADRYPLNGLSAMLINIVFAFPIYVLPVFIPQVTWVVAVTMLANFGQVIVHGIVINVKAKTIYNPGCFAVFCLHVPLSIIFICYVTKYGMMQPIEWLYAVLGTVACAGCCIAAPQRLMANKNTQFVFSQEEITIHRFWKKK